MTKMRIASLEWFMMEIMATVVQCSKDLYGSCESERLTEKIFQKLLCHKYRL
jgi:hypothetical protein